MTAATDTKVYDGSTASGGEPTITVGSLAPGDTATWTQTFDHQGRRHHQDAHARPGSVSDGNGGANYTVTLATVATGTITARPLAVTATGVNKVYDGNTDGHGHARGQPGRRRHPDDDLRERLVRR